MKIETASAPLDTRSPYEIATAARTDPRNSLDVASDVMDLELPQLMSLYEKLGIFGAEDGTTYSLQTLMTYLKEAVVTGAEIEKEHPGLVDSVLEKHIPAAQAEVESAKEKEQG